MLKIEKVVDSVTLPLEPNTISLVKKNNIINSYITDNSGNNYYEIGLSNNVNILGETTIVRNDPTPGAYQNYYDYIITDYDNARLYNIVAISGSVSRSDDYISYVPPTVTGMSGFIVNGKIFNIDITDPYVDIPVILNPTINAIIYTSGVSITATNIVVLGFDADFEAADWQLSDSPAFTNIISEVTASSVNEVNWTVYDLTPSTTYYARVRQKAVGLNYSGWSLPVSFTTASNFAPGIELAKINSFSNTLGDSFGMQVTLSRDGTKASISALDAANTSLTTPGIVHLYNVVDGTLVYENSISAYNASDNAFFGQSVDMADNGNTIVISAPTVSHSGFVNAGRVYIYVKNGINWDLEQEIISPNPGDSLQFGHSVSISADGNTLIVGEPFNIAKTYIYNRSAGVWTLTATLSGEIDSQFGYSVKITADGTRAIIGCYWGSGSATSIYVNNAGTWSIESSLTTSTTFGNGFNVTINDNGDTAVVGSCYEGSLVNSSGLSGAIYIYSRSGSVWTLAARLEPSSPKNSIYFGSCVSINVTGDKILASARNDIVDGVSLCGAVYLFEKIAGVWTEINQIVPLVLVQNGSFGFSLDMNADGNLFIAGSNDDTYNVSKGGAVYLFNF